MMKMDVDPQTLEIVLNMLKIDESYRRFPFIDSTGHSAIGLGRNLSSVGISLDESIYLATNDIRSLNGELINSFAWFNNLSKNRAAAILDMAYNLGMEGFCTFRKFIGYMEIGDYANAAKEGLNSKWSSQVGMRAQRLMHIIETDQLPT
jgi:lysozyme